MADDALCAQAIAVAEVAEDDVKGLRPAAVAAEQPVFDSHDIYFSLTTQMTRHWRASQP